MQRNKTRHLLELFCMHLCASMKRIKKKEFSVQLWSEEKCRSHRWCTVFAESCSHAFRNMFLPLNSPFHNETSKKPKNLNTAKHYMYAKSNKLLTNRPSKLPPRSRVLLKKPTVFHLTGSLKYFLELEVSLPFHKSPPLVPIPRQMNAVHIIQSYFSKIYPHQKLVCVSLLSHVCYMPYSSQPPSTRHSN